MLLLWVQFLSCSLTKKDRGHQQYFKSQPFVPEVGLPQIPGAQPETPAISSLPHHQTLLAKFLAGCVKHVVLSPVSISRECNMGGGAIFVLAVECWATEISARSEAGAPEDHHCLRQRGRPPEEIRECLEAEPEARDASRRPREHQDPGEARPWRALWGPALH